MSGSQIHYGFEVAREIRDEDPNMPIVWGGVHPTLLSEQTIQNEFVDIVVRRDGEETIVELTNAIKNNSSFDEIKGLTYIKNGKIINTPEREFPSLNEVVNLNYDLIKLDKYLDSKEYFSYSSTSDNSHTNTTW